MEHLESQEQRALIQWAEWQRMPGANEKVSDYLFAIPNGGKRNKIEAARLRKEGVKAGVSDLFLAHPSGSLHGLWIEMKRNRKDYSYESLADVAVTDLQAMWLDRMERAGYQASVCYGAEQAITTIKSYLGIPL